MTTIKIGVQDGTTLPAYLARPAADPAPTGVIVMHELFGVNPDIRGVADDLARAGYLAIAPEFYHRDAEPGRWLERDDAGQRAQIRAALAAAGVQHELVSYPGVGHAFFWPGTPPFDATARADAWGRVLELLAS